MLHQFWWRSEFGKILGNCINLSTDKVLVKLNVDTDFIENWSNLYDELSMKFLEYRFSVTPVNVQIQLFPIVLQKEKLFWEYFEVHRETGNSYVCIFFFFFFLPSSRPATWQKVAPVKILSYENCEIYQESFPVSIFSLWQKKQKKEKTWYFNFKTRNCFPEVFLDL